MTRRVVITGSCGGLGRAFVRKFQAEGWRVTGIDRRKPESSHMPDEFIHADIGQDGEVARAFEIIRNGGRLDAIVNNAAVQLNKPIAETTDDEWSHVINTNVRSAFQTIRESTELLAESRGAVVNISSVHAIATSVNVAVYAISKGALAALTRSAAVELAAAGVRCNAVLPGAVDTAMLRDGLDRRPHVDGIDGNFADLVAGTPLGFVATPDQIAPSVFHLADSEQSPYTTGQMLIVDGGVTARLGSE
jgi:NAD(P)-dependent dehydrogenase (short-subunit alcohol dehydrogenase family)